MRGQSHNTDFENVSKWGYGITPRAGKQNRERGQGEYNIIHNHLIRIFE